MKKKLSKISQYGSMMVEALAMLGLITMVTPVLYKKAAERTTELQDINTASQMRTLSKALDDFIMDNYQDLSEEAEGEILLSKEDILPYLPYNFNVDDSKLFNEYQFALRNDLINAGTDSEHSAITGMVLAPSRNSKELPMIRAAKIASMVGANGGIVDKSKTSNIQGVQGAWQANLEDFGFEDDAENGSLVVSSIHAVTSSGGSGSAALAENVLFRDASKGPEYNTMQTTLYMNDHNIEGVNTILGSGGDESGAGALLTIGSPLNVSGDTTITGLATISGNAEISGDGTISGALSAASATITNALTAGSAEIAGIFNVNPSGAGGAPVSISANTAITGEVAITGNVGVKSGMLAAEQGIVAKGSASVMNDDGSIADSYSDDFNENYSLVSEGNLLVEANAHFKGLAQFDDGVEAEYLYGRTELGGGMIGSVDNPQYNFIATSDDVTIKNPYFSVDSGNDRLVINDTESYIGAASARIMTEDDGDFGRAKIFAGNSNFYMDNTSTEIEVNTDDGDYNRLSMTGTTSTMTNANADGSMKTVLQTDPGLARIENYKDDISASRLSIGTDYAQLAHDVVSSGSRVGGGSLDIDNNKLKLGFDASTSINSSITMEDGDILLESNNQYGNLLVETKNVNIDEDRFLYDGEDFVIDEDPELQEDGEGGDMYANRTSGVRINRNGIIQLPASTVADRTNLDPSRGYQNVPGYIKLDRIIANQAYPEFGGSLGVGDGDYDTEASVPYDAYQLNPAYTSVMHDIKLTTRGGARLSDILPDFINKGIYVLDNTYMEDHTNKEWDTYQVSVGSQITVSNAPGECSPTDMDCIASPWLGFVPAPQCPPGYSKVITINPIRWKMSEAFYIPTDVTPSSTEIGRMFREYFVPRTNPMNAGFKMEPASGDNHTHVISSGWPLTFQTNTWLNTTISGVYGTREGGDSNTAQNSTDENLGRKSGFIGWHAIMGFLYNAYDYSEYLTKTGQNSANYEGKIVWNLFPVYNQEMTAIADVYCYFERRNMSSGSPAWEWDTDYVDSYDQITNFRFGFEKNNSGYNDRLNDPALGYDEVW